MSHRPIALIGIDGTLLASMSNADFDYSDTKCAKPIIGVLEMALALHLDNWRLIGVTSRAETWRKPTTEWLLKHEVPLDKILMRADDDYSTAPELKLALAKKYFGAELRNLVHLVVDDREDVLACFNALGITTMLVHGGA